MSAAREAGTLILDRYRDFARMETAPADISTEADKSSQELIIGKLLSVFGSDGICAEENTPLRASAPVNSDRFWVIDPIDGTRGFALKNGEFAVMIGLVFAGEVVVGVVHEPAIDRTTFAVRGGGCHSFRGNESASTRRVSTTPSLQSCIASVSRSQSEKSDRRFRDAFGVARTMATYSAGIKLAQIARGETDFYLGDYLGLKDWDVCAGHILVEEAGGRVTDVDGRPIRYDGSGKSLKYRGILASNAACHESAVEILIRGDFRPT